MKKIFVPFLFIAIICIACNKPKTESKTEPAAQPQSQQQSNFASTGTSVQNPAGPAASATASKFPQLKWTERKAGSGQGWYNATIVKENIVLVNSTKSILTSIDGITWTQRSMDIPGYFHSGQYVNGKFILLGNEGIIAVSDDGSSWAVHKAGPKGPENYLYSIVYGNGHFAMISAEIESYKRRNHSILLSPDGKTWKAKNIPDNMAASGREIARIDNLVFGNGRFIMVNSVNDSKNVFSRNAVYSSSDAQKWDKRLTTDKQLASIYFLNGRFFAVTTDNKPDSTSSIFTSMDGQTWSEHSLKVSDNKKEPISSMVIGNGLYVATMNNVKYTNNELSSNTPVRIMTSTDGLNWVLRHTITDSILWSRLYYADGLFIIVGWGEMSAFEKNGQAVKVSVSLSRNGTDWETQYIDVAGRVFDIAYDKGRFILVGDKRKSVLKGREWVMEGEKELIMTATLEGK